jgi:hypothetical protein
MEAETVDRLQVLIQLYHEGYRSPLIDQAVGKLIELEADRSQVELQRLEARLSAYEQRYNMASDEFYRRFQCGELGDDMDFVEWSVFWEMHQATKRRLEELTKRTHDPD